MTTEFTFESKVISVTEKQRVVRGWKNPDGTTDVATQNLGWFLHLDGSHEAIHLGYEKPGLRPGDVVEVTVRKRVR